MADPRIVDARLPVENKYGPLGTPTTLVVHHGESARDRDDAHALEILRGYHDLHVSNGWGGIGYHFAVTSAGTLVKLRPVGWKGAHAPPNTGRIGVVLIGSYDTRDAPNAAQIATLRWLYHHGQSVGVPAGLRLGGHRDFVSTDCPGDRLYGVLPQIRQEEISVSAGPHRDLSIRRPHLKGADVTALQQGINRLSRPGTYGLPLVTVDGDFGSGTLGRYKASGARGVGYYLGAADSQIGPGKPVSRHLQQIIRAPWRRYPQEQVRGKARYLRRRLELRSVNTPQKKAQYIEDSPHVDWATWLSTGSDEQRLNEIESPINGTNVYVPHFDRWVKLNTRILDFLYDCAKAGERHGGKVIVNAWTGGVHSSDASLHYIDAALDLAIQSTLPYGVMEALWRKHGAFRNSETSHIHLNFPAP